MASSTLFVIAILATFMTAVIQVNRRVFKHARDVMAVATPPAIALGGTLRRYAVILGGSAFAILFLDVFADQNIDTSTSTGRLMFNMLASIAEFENDLRAERQAEGIAKAKENGVKFGRPAKVTDSIRQDLHSRRLAGAAIGQLAKEFRLGEATVYRALKSIRPSDGQPAMKTTKVILWLQVENNSKFVRGKGKSRQHIEDYILAEYDAKKLEKDSWEYELTFQYTDDEDLERQIYDLSAEMSHEADLRNGFVECSFTEVRTDRSW